MLQSSARLLRLLSLLQSQRFWAGSELARRLEVTSRTLRRDVDRLRSLGYPVDATPGVAGGYQLAAGARLPPLQLQDDEALAVSIALRTATGSAVDGVEEAAVRALVKLERVLPARVRERVHALRAAISPLPRAGFQVDVNALCSLANACTEHLQIRFQYPSRSAPPSTPTASQGNKAARRSDTPSEQPCLVERCVDPVGLAHCNARWYLVAWDTMRNDWRTFRVDRIHGTITGATRFTPRPLPEGGDLKAYVARSIALGAYGQRARIRLHASFEEMTQRLAPSMGVLEADGDHRCVLLTATHSLDALVGWLCWLAVEFEVEQPAELVEHLRQHQARLRRAIRRSADRHPPRPAGSTRR